MADNVALYKGGKWTKWAFYATSNEKKRVCDQMMGSVMLKWYLRIYIFIEYLKCVWKSNCIWII